jgi:hypothetical protein
VALVFELPVVVLLPPVVRELPAPAVVLLPAVLLMPEAAVSEPELEVVVDVEVELEVVEGDVVTCEVVCLVVCVVATFVPVVAAGVAGLVVVVVGADDAVAAPAASDSLDCFVSVDVFTETFFVVIVVGDWCEDPTAATYPKPTISSTAVIIVSGVCCRNQFRRTTVGNSTVATGSNCSCWGTGASRS